MASFQKPDDDYVDIGSMIARSVPEIAPGVGFCDEDEEELGILVVGLAYVEYVECGFHPSEAIKGFQDCRDSKIATQQQQQQQRQQQSQHLPVAKSVAHSQSHPH